jgi:hypothetical protein
MNTEQRLAKLEREVAELIQWKADRMRQQVTYPLDNTSIDIINKHFMRITGDYTYTAGAGANAFLVKEGIQDNNRFEVTSNYIEYTANASTDLLTIKYPNGTSIFTDDTQVILITTNTAPTGLTADGSTSYYVVNAASDGASFKLSASAGGAAINLTTDGVGRQFIKKL